MYWHWVTLARTTHEITKSFRIPFIRSEFRPVGKTVCIPLLACAARTKSATNKGSVERIRRFMNGPD
jgi:hypothetical protein